jgi:hypothetical protein
MTKVKGFDMTSNREIFVKGATAYRNTRDLAKTQRDGFLDQVNHVARQMPTPSPTTTLDQRFAAVIPFPVEFSSWITASFGRSAVSVVRSCTAAPVPERVPRSAESDRYHHYHEPRHLTNTYSHTLRLQRRRGVWTSPEYTAWYVLTHHSRSARDR